jgi:hypothetical protein
VTRWPGCAPAVSRWPAPSRRLPSVRPPEWCFEPPESPEFGGDWGPRREWWQRCMLWCEDADYSPLDLLRLRGWRRGERVSRFPDDPPDLFPVEWFGIDR